MLKTINMKFRSDGIIHTTIRNYQDKTIERFESSFDPSTHYENWPKFMDWWRLVQKNRDQLH
jgi:hypothetical protein